MGQSEIEVEMLGNNIHQPSFSNNISGHDQGYKTNATKSQNQLVCILVLRSQNGSTLQYENKSKQEMF